MRQRGFDQIQLICVVVALGILLAGAVLFRSYIASVDQAAFDRGVAETKAAALQDELEREAAVDEALLEEQKKKEAATELAAENDRKWKEARREADRKHVALASCTVARAAESAGSAGAVAEEAAGGPGIRTPGSDAGDRAGDPPGIALHWSFVSLHDGAFTGLGGESLSGLAAELAGDPARAGAPSPYGLGELLDINAENARSLSACRRAVAEIRGKVEAAASAWKSKGRN